MMEIGARSFENALYIFEYALGLLADVGPHYLSGFGIERDLS
jgi:hypothetical protein